MTKLTIHITLTENNEGFWLAKAPGPVSGSVTTDPESALLSLVAALGLRGSEARAVEDRPTKAWLYCFTCGSSHYQDRVGDRWRCPNCHSYRA